MCDIREQIVTSRRLWWWLEVWLSSLQERRKSYWVLLADTTTINIIIIMVIFLWSSCDIYMNESFFSFIFYVVFNMFKKEGRFLKANRRRLHFCVVHWIKKNMYNIYHETPPEKKNAFYAAAATKNSVKTTSSSSRSTVQLLILKDKNSIWSCGGTKF